MVFQQHNRKKSIVEKKNSDSNGKSVLNLNGAEYVFCNYDPCLHIYLTFLMLLHVPLLPPPLLTRSYLDLDGLLFELYLLIISVVLLEWVCGQMIFVSLMRWFSAVIHSSVKYLT